MLDSFHADMGLENKKNGVPVCLRGEGSQIFCEVVEFLNLWVVKNEGCVRSVGFLNIMFCLFRQDEI